MEKQFEVWVGNLGKYVEGNLSETWIAFPTTEKDLESALEKIGIGGDYKETMIMDTDIPAQASYLRDIIGEYTRLDDLNMIASLMETHAPDNETINLFADNYGKMDIEELGNLLLQSEEIPYYPYSFPGLENAENLSPEEKYGYTTTHQSGIYEKLEELGMEYYVDFEAIGRDARLNGAVALGDNGYMDLADGGNINLHRYSLEELFAEAGLKEKKEQIIQAADSIKKTALKPIAAPKL